MEKFQKLNEELKAQRQRYLAITNTLREAIIVANLDGIIIECNRAAEDIFGWEPSTLIGKNILELVPFQYKEAHSKGMENFRRTGISQMIGSTVDLEGLRKDGTTVPIGLSITKVEVDSVVLLCAVIRDVTYRKEQEKKISLLNEVLNTRIASLEAFQFSIAHDLNAPLRSLEGFSEILLEDYYNELNDTGKDVIRRIRHAVIRMKNLVTDMLRLSKVSQVSDINIETVNLSEVVSECLKEHVEIYNTENRKYRFEIEPEIFVEADKEFISIAIYNLVSNAWKFTSKEDLTVIKFGENIIDGKTVYYIEDNGVGFDMDKADLLFKPFSRLHNKNEFEGNGIGLTIVKQIIRIHDGEVWAEGAINQGATFYFTLGNTNARTN
jgi:PAS domain S-box-containing protein